MARLGIVRQPGMAAELMEQLKPLLAADGVDLDDPDGVDLDTLQGALDRATERHNMRLFTPVDAVGVSHRPAQERAALWDDLDTPTPKRHTIHALSMTDVTLLFAWWQALRIADVIEITSTRVRPGSAAAAWQAGQHPPLEVAELVAGVFIAELALLDVTRPIPAFAQAFVAQTVAMLIVALDPDLEFNGPAGLSDLLKPGALQVMEGLADEGLVDREADGYVVPPALRFTVARGTMLIIPMAAVPMYAR